MNESNSFDGFLTLGTGSTCIEPVLANFRFVGNERLVFNRHSEKPTPLLNIKQLESELEDYGPDEFFLSEITWLRHSGYDDVCGYRWLDYLRVNNLLVKMFGWREAIHIARTMSAHDFESFFGKNFIIFWKTVGLDDDNNLAVFCLFADGKVLRGAKLVLAATIIDDTYIGLAYPELCKH